MRTKDEILDDARCDITSEVNRDTAHLWLEVRKIEALIDIKDIIKDAATAIILQLGHPKEKH